MHMSPTCHMPSIGIRQHVEPLTSHNIARNEAGIVPESMPGGVCMIVASMHLNQSNPAALRPLRDFNFQVWQSLGLTLPLDLGPSCDFNLNCLPSAFGAPWHGYCSPPANSGWESCCDTLGDNLTCPAASTSKDCFFGLVFLRGFWLFSPPP